MRVELPDGTVLDGSPDEVMAMLRLLRPEGTGAPVQAERTAPSSSAKTVRELWAQFAPYAELRIKSFKTHQRYIERHVLAFFGDMKWSELDQVKVDEYVAKRSEDPGRSTDGKTSPMTRRREITWLASCLKWALKRRLITRHPLRGLEQESIKHRRRKAYLDWPTFEKLLSYSPNEMASDMFRVWMLDGFRLSELRLATKSEIDHERQRIVIHGSRTKNGDDKAVPLSNEGYEIVRRWAEVSKSEWIFANPRKHAQPVPARTVNNWFVTARRKSGIKGLGGRPDEVIVTHGLRRSWATGMAAQGTPLQLMQIGGGWNSPEMVKEYAQWDGATVEALRDFKNRHAGAAHVRPKKAGAKATESEAEPSVERPAK